MLDEMNTGGKSLTEDSTDEVVDLNKWDDMEVEVKAIGICILEATVKQMKEMKLK